MKAEWFKVVDGNFWLRTVREIVDMFCTERLMSILQTGNRGLGMIWIEKEWNVFHSVIESFEERDVEVIG